MKQRIKKIRYTVPDIIRGVSVIAMIVYHTMWDLVYLFGVSVPWFKTDMGFLFQQSICWSFVLISGFCWHLGKKKIRRGIIVLACSLVLTAVTAIVMPEQIILHGVLSLIGTAMLVTIPLDKIFKKVHPLWGIVISFLLFLLTYDVNNGFVGIAGHKLFELPENLYLNTVTAFFGFPHDAFYSSDYVPILPWIFVFFIGYFIYALLEKRNKLNFLSRFTCKPIEFIGRHSLEIYMAHQPIIFGILFLIFK